MRYGIVSDIHGNLEALTAALAFLDGRGVDRLLCLGDLVGYNADSAACVRLLEERGAASIAGNHDLIAARALGLDRCSDKAAFALRRTRRTLAEGTRRALLELPRLRVIEGEIVLVHGSFADVREYMRDARRIEAAAAAMRRIAPRAWLCLHGHTHAPALHVVEAEPGGASPLPLGEEVPLDRPERVERAGRVFFANPGSVDAARRGDGHAELAVLDAGRRTISFHRVPYDHARAERRAVEGGYRMGWADERIQRVTRALRRVKRLLARGGGDAALPDHR